MSAYNHEKFVEQAILSIFTQTYQDFELIVLDDGSSDRTPDILESLSQKYGFFFKRQSNQGIAKSYNQLIHMSRGVYITGCASDDFWPPTRLEQQVALLDAKPDVDLVHGRASIVVNGEVRYGDVEGGNPFVNGTNEFRPFLRWKRNFVTGSKMVRTEVFERIGYYREDLQIEDFDWWLRATRHLNIHFEDRVWLYYRRHDGNFIKDPEKASIWCDDYYTVCRELGLRNGLHCFFGGLNVLIQCENTAGRRRRFAYYVLLPFALVNKRTRRTFERFAKKELRALRNRNRLLRSLTG